MADEDKTPAAPATPDIQDTRTRKTVRLRTNSAPQTQDTPLSDPLTTRDTDTGNLEILDDTQTRKTLKLKPMAPGAGALPRVSISSSPDTNTRKTVVLRPVSPGGGAPTPPPPAPAPAPAAPAAEAEPTGTVKVKQVKPPKPGVAPVSVTPPGGAAPTVKLTPPP
ncbi:MAG: hypothetical protein IJT50_10830, partial [Lentisphaeria bacterium]|nr:hypothetical protein [Lentisphaeria bacterium]